MKGGISHETSTCTRTALSYGRSSAFRLQPDLNPALITPLMKPPVHW